MSFGQFQFRRDTAANWTSANPTLLSGEMGIETDTSKYKIGNGSTAWTSLAYGGTTGAPGQGVPTGGTTNQILAKNTATDYDSSWKTFDDAMHGTRGSGTTGSPFHTAATTSAPGFLSAADKTKVDNLWYDVTNYGLVGNDSTDNASAWAALFSSLPVGATVYFPTGTYRTSAEFAISADKHLRIIGAGKYASSIKSTSTTANIFNINGSYWYNTFEDLRFESSVTKTNGAAIFINPGASGSAVGTNVYRCSFNGQFYGIYALSASPGGQAANLSVWDSLDIAAGPVNSRGLKINGETTNLVISNSTINLGFPPFQVAGTACIEINQSGAVQMTGNDFIGGTNTLLLDASSGGSTSVAAVYCTNTFFDQSAGSTVKITGANIVNRVKFVQCGITGGNIAGSAAFEIASGGTGAAGTATAKADGIDIFDCDIYPNGGSGTTNGILITGAQGVNISGNRISGWTNGIQITPTVSNGYTKINIEGNKMGATNNFTTPNTVGVLLNAGSFQYGPLTIADNDFTGSTTPITDNAAMLPAAQKKIADNVGMLLTGLAASTITSPALTTTLTQLIRMPIPSNGLQIGDVIRVIVVGAIAAAGNPSIHLKFGTAGTTADTSILTHTPTWAAAQQGTFTMFLRFEL